MRQYRQYLASVPAERVPNLTGMPDLLAPEVIDDRFDFRMGVLVAGLSAKGR